MPPDWEPPFPASESEFNQATRNISLAVLGIQYDTENHPTALDFAIGLSHLAKYEGKADHVDLAICEKDCTGRCQMVATGYWLIPKHLETFLNGEDFKAYWARHSAEGLPYGIFREVFNLPSQRFETLHSGPDHIVGKDTSIPNLLRR